MTGTLTDLSAEYLIARGIAPVKREYWKPITARQEVAAVGSALAQRSSAPAERKTKKKARQEREAQINICNSFLAGHCEFDGKCRFSHDAEAFLAQKPKELHGQCPFIAAASCPYGISCMFASTHSDTDEQTAKLLKAHQSAATATASSTGKPTEVQAAATAAADATVHSEVPAGPTVELADKTAHGTDEMPGKADQAAVSAQISDIPDHVELPVPSSIEQEVNVLPREVQTQLRKKSYSFMQADAVLLELGIRNTWQAPANKQKGKTNSKAEKRQQGGNADVDVGTTQQANKKARTDAQAPEAEQAAAGATDTAANLQQLPSSSATPLGSANPTAHPNAEPSEAPAASQAAAQAGDAAADARAESILHVPETSAMPIGSANPDPQPNGHIPDNSALESRPPATSSAPAADPPASQTSLAAAAAAAMGGQPLPASNVPSQLQDADAAQANGTAQPAASGMNGQASSGAQLAHGPTAKLYDVNRAKQQRAEASDMHVDVPLRPSEKKSLDLKGKLYLAPLTTVGNLPFRRVCKGLGADITCGEMALATNLLQGQASEWALIKRHPCEDVFGVQVCGGYPDALSRTAELIEENCDVSFVDVNMGCPIDLICDRNAGSSLLQRPRAIESIVRSMSSVLSCPLTIKVRKGFMDNKDVAHTFLPNVKAWGGSAVTLHGRSRQQRYSRSADWEYISQCAQHMPDLPLIGNGDVFSWTDYEAHVNGGSPIATTMIARGALMKPWIFQEIKEQRHMDITASERLDILKHFCSNGLEHWGSDAKGVETTRRFLLEWLSFLYRYVPVGLLEVVPQVMQWRPPAFCGRSDLETLLASDNAADWVRISEMLLGPTPASFSFAPKHKSNAYANSETGMAQSREADQENG